jgi:hypothetical protein
VTALASLLIGSGAVSREKLMEAERRRTVYGGSLDTVLLETGAVDERTMTVHLAEVSGLPAPLPERLVNPDPEVRAAMPAAEARRLSAAPFGRKDGTVELALHPEADAEAVAAWAESAGVAVSCHVVPEVRFRELLAVLYGEVVPPRFVAILGRLMGADRTRQRAAPLVAAPAPAPPPVETGPLLRPRPRPPAPPPRPEPEPEPEIEIVEEPPPPPAEQLERLLAAARAEDAGAATAAISALAERRAPEAVPLLIERLGVRGPVGTAAAAALVAITAQDFGEVQRRWLGWWEKAQHRSRTEWLFEALAHKRSDLRLAASQELQAATGVYFGYHFDLPERDREEARRRWMDWWHTATRARTSGGRP